MSAWQYGQPDGGSAPSTTVSVPRSPSPETALKALLTVDAGHSNTGI
jgi:hypothetical protein